MMQSPKLYDVVALTEDVPEEGLVRGQVGAVVEQHTPDVFEVEFADPQGRTHATLALCPPQFMVLRYELVPT